MELAIFVAANFTFLTFRSSLFWKALSFSEHGVSVYIFVFLYLHVFIFACLKTKDRHQNKSAKEI